jgi:hypothetical protein
MQNGSLFFEERPSRRIQLIENALKNDPFLYHKRKNVISTRFNDSNEENGQKTNEELLFCQDENLKQINNYKNNIKSKSSTIEANAHNYITYMMREKNSMNKINPTEQNSHQISFTPNKYPFLPNKMNVSSSSKNINSKSMSYDENNLINNLYNDKSMDGKNYYLNRVPNLKGTDITDQNYYDKISKQLILQMNKNYMDYNQNLFNKRYSPLTTNKMLFIKNDSLALPPGHISNPRYYNLGESRLKSNPIVNPGNRAPIFNYSHHHKLKSELYS